MITLNPQARPPRPKHSHATRAARDNVSSATSVYRVPAEREREQEPRSETWSQELAEFAPLLAFFGAWLLAAAFVLVAKVVGL